MSQQKIVFDLARRDTAHRAAGLLEELLQPTPDAVTVFETPQDEKTGTDVAWRVETYFDEDQDSQKLQRDIATCLAPLTPQLRLEAIPDKNWVAISQAALPPVPAGRFTIYGSHDRDRIAQGPNAILIDAGEAFGTAHHPTTFGCLRAIDQLSRRAKPIRNALDLGCGSAILSIALARAKSQARIIASDVDPQSVVVARTNLRLNGVGRRVTAHVASGLTHKELRNRQPFDLIIANILAGPLVALAPDISKAVSPGGHLILSGILKTQAAEVQARYVAHGFAVCSKMRFDEWTTLILERKATTPHRTTR